MRLKKTSPKLNAQIKSLFFVQNWENWKKLDAFKPAMSSSVDGKGQKKMWHLNLVIINNLIIA